MTLAAPLLLLVANLGAAPYHWPLEMPKQLTSSFAEYRPGRFHAGIDLRTGRVGVPVHAADDGYISRVRCSPYGYGKAVYLQLDDGNTVVYGHLDDFTDEVRAYVRAAQHRAESYTVDLTPEPGRFPVKRGDLVAKSGQTGIGAPHLHYEIRDAAQRPVNPRLLGIDWPDTRAPELRGLAVAPVGVDSRVNGGLDPVALEVTHLGNGRYRANAVEAAGPVAFGLDVVDADGGYRLGVYEMRLVVDGTERFVMRHDRLSYDNHRNALAAYHPVLRGQGRFLMLWRWPGVTCDSYTVTRDDGAVVPGTAPLPVEITVTDFMGNTAVVTLELRRDNEPAALPAGEPGVQFDWRGPALDVAVRLPEGATGPPDLLVEHYDDIVPVVAVEAGPGRYLARLAPEGGGPSTLHVSHPALPAGLYPFFSLRRGEPAREARLGEVGLRVGPDAPYGLFLARCEVVEKPPAAPIPLRGKAWRLWPDQMPLDAMIEVSLPLPEDVGDPRRAQVYRAGGGWSRENGRIEGGRFVFETRELGTYAVLEDDQAPSIAEVLPRDGYRAQTRRPLVEATIDDVGSGIDGIEVRCDGQWLLTAYDPEHRRIVWERDEELPPGEHTITFTITDHAGNTTIRTRTVVIPG